MIPNVLWIRRSREAEAPPCFRIQITIVQNDFGVVLKLGVSVENYLTDECLHVMQPTAKSPKQARDRKSFGLTEPPEF